MGLYPRYPPCPDPGPDLEGGIYPPTLTWDGSTTCSDLGWGMPHTPPPCQEGWRYPPIRKDGVPPLAGWGSPLPSVDRQTDVSQIITFPRTSYAGGKNCPTPTPYCHGPWIFIFEENVGCEIKSVNLLDKKLINKLNWMSRRTI